EVSAEPAGSLSGNSEVGGLASGENEIYAQVYYLDPFGQWHSYYTLHVPVTVGEAVPVNNSAPSLGGTAKRGYYLYVADNGSWSELPANYGYQWLRCNKNGAGCAVIPEAVSYYYLLQPEDVGHTIRLRVTATNAHGSGSPADSAASEVVRDAFTPVNTKAPAVSGNAVKGDVLVADEGEWSNEPQRYDFQWLRCD